jgi:hypothetical protein
MNNHAHELYRVTDNLTLARILHDVKGHFSRKFNERFGRTGHFWKNKPFYKIVQDETYAYQSSYYYHWNPVRAGLVSHPRDWPFSGYRFHIENDRSGIIGQLLDPYPNVEAEDIILNTSLDNNSKLLSLLRDPTQQFLGDTEFIKRMSEKYEKK